MEHTGHAIPMDTSPIKLSPACKGYLWGGSRLWDSYGIQTDLQPLAEAWILSAHPDGLSRVQTGPFAGRDFTAYLQAVCGADMQRFPLLIKLIDAKRDLSVQVHPDDAAARAQGRDSGKAEAWIVLSAEPDAGILFGFQRKVTPDEVRAAIQNGSLPELLRRVPVKAGDVFFLPPGTVHALGAGITVCEIQQNADITYRLYDYGRLDRDGKPRALHVEEALAVADLKAAPDEVATKLPIDCPWFRICRYDVDGTSEQRISPDSFHALVAVEGNGRLIMRHEMIDFQKGDCLFIPAQDGAYTLEGKAALVCTMLPKDQD